MSLIDRINSRIRRAAKSVGLAPASRPFVLLCHQRSGSNMLTSMLNKHPEVRLYGQLFKDDPAFRARADRLTGLAFTGHPFDDQVDARDRFDRLESRPGEREPRNTEAYLKNFFERLDASVPERRLGFKFHGGTLYRDEIESLVFNGEYKIVVLHREDLLATAISWYQARETDLWASTKKVGVREDITMDPELVGWFIDKIKHDVRLWRELVAASGAEVLQLTYEQITSEAFRLTQLWDFLEVRDLGEVQPATKKLIKSYDHILNYAELQARFGNETIA